MALRKGISLTVPWHEGRFERRCAIGSGIFKTRGFFIALIFLFFGFHASRLMAEDGNLKGRIMGEPGARWQITADKMSYMEKERVVTAEGDVVIRRGAQSLSAQKATYNEKTGIVEVSGGVRWESEGDVLEAEKAVFDLNKSTGTITEGRLFLRENNFRISGESIEKVGPNTYRIKDFKATACDGEKPAWSFTGSEMSVTLEGYGKVKHVAFRIKDFPVFYVPYAVFPAKTKRQSGLLLPAVGYSRLNGYGFEQPIYWAISEQTDATFYERYMSERGLMQGLEFRYVAPKDSKGDFLFDILSDDIETKNLSDPEQVKISPFPRTNQTRYWLRSKTDQQLPLGIEARLDTDYVSDQDYLREFPGLTGFSARPDLAAAFGRPVEEIWSPTRRSALRLGRDGTGYSLQGLSSYNELPEHPPENPLPQTPAALNYTLLPRQTPVVPMFFLFNTNYEYIWRETGITGQNLSITPELSYPVWFGRYLAFEPSIAYSWDSQWLGDNPLGINQQSRDVYQAGAKLSTVLERVFEYNGKSIKRLKHKFSPSLVYEYRVPGDEDQFKPWFEPIQLEGKVNRVSLLLENFLDSRREDAKGNATYDQWGSLRLSQGYDINEATNDADPSHQKTPWDPLLGALSLRPFPEMDLQASAQWDWYADDVPSANISLLYSPARSGGRQDHYRVNYDYLKAGNRYLSFDIDVNLVYGYSIGGTLQRNLVLKETVSGSLWLDYQSQCWGIRASIEQLNGINSVYVTFRLLNLGGFKGGTSISG